LFVFSYVTSLGKTNSNNKVTCRLVGPQNVLWTCRKACKIEFGDCCFCLCSVCYNEKAMHDNLNGENAGQNLRKRRRVRNLDDNVSICNHDVNALVPFMDGTFFTKKYKQTIQQENYKLPLICSNCEMELVDKLGGQQKNKFAGIVAV